jgi:DNA-binding NarL/FixJ family response regulator
MAWRTPANLASSPLPVLSGQNATALVSDRRYDSAAMNTPLVTVTEPTLAFRRGLESSLVAAGLRPESPPDVVSWAADGPERVVVVTLDETESCHLIDQVTTAGGAVVALLPEPRLDAFVHALRHGAVSAVDWGADPDAIASVVAAACRGLAVLPSQVARSLARQVDRGHGPVVGDDELAWLLSLAAGQTVVDLATEVGYSERSMFRKLHDLYEKLGVQNRSSAIREAERLGLLRGAKSGGSAAEVSQ